MKVLGIVAEFNPFHNGHHALLEAARRNDYTHLVAIMSGNFVQRGQPAHTDKWVRTHAALAGGVDLVLELPLPFATATAMHFAGGAVASLYATGVVDALGFGSECGDVQELWNIARLLQHPDYTKELTAQLPLCPNFATARTQAVHALLGAKAAQILTCPNNLLAVEYLSAAQKLGWTPDVFTLSRQGVGHHSTRPQPPYASATYLRQQEQTEALAPFVPPSALSIYEQAVKDGRWPALPAPFEAAVLSHLRRLTAADFARLPDISEGLENRLVSAVATAETLDALYESIQSKRYPTARARRLVLAGFLELTATDPVTPPPYLRVLGAGRRGKDLLGQMAHKATLPFSHRLLTLEKESPAAARFAALEKASTDQYGLLFFPPQPVGWEYTQPALF